MLKDGIGTPITRLIMIYIDYWGIYSMSMNPNTELLYKNILNLTHLLNLYKM